MSTPATTRTSDAGLRQIPIPRFWYNVLADLPFELPPPIHPATGKPLTPSDLEPLFPKTLIQQEGSRERWIEIPEEVRQAYALWRPTPLYRARRLEKVLQTPARIYFKFEGVSPTGSHKPNTAVAQAFFNAMEGVRALTTETGAGQWGSSLAFAGSLFGIDVEVFMVRVSYRQKPYRRTVMELYGARVYPSPSDQTDFGRGVLQKFPEHPGSLGIAITEAIESAIRSEGKKKYSLGSVLNHVLLHQTVIGLEARNQMELLGEEPDVLIGAVGGGSNFAGLVFPFLQEVFQNGKQMKILAVEPAAVPSLTRGKYTYDFGDTGKTTPLLKMHTLGNAFVPPPIHAGGLRYHGMAPIVSALKESGYIQAVAVPQKDTFASAVQFARCEGIIPAPESAHAVHVAIQEAIRAREEGKPRVILFNLSGHGFLDLQAYEQFLANELEDEIPTDEMIRESLQSIPSDLRSEPSSGG